MTNKELVTAFFMEGYVSHNYDYLLKIMADDYLDHSPCAAKSNLECVNVLKNTAKTFADMKVDIQDLIEEDNKVTVRAVFSGTHSSEVYGIAPTGKQIAFEALEIFRMENGKIVESWGYWPDALIMQMLKNE